MSAVDHRLCLRPAAMTARAGALACLVFLSALAGFVSGPVGDAQAQQQPAGMVYRIGLLSQGQPPKAYIEALQQGLRERGYAEGRNLVWELRSTDGGLEQLSQFAEELVRLKVDVILARASSGAMAAKRATTSVPIVFFAVYAPVEIGLVPSLGHPGGNITGIAVNASDMVGKRVQLLKELVPTLKRVAMLSHPAHPTNAVQLEGAETAARTSRRAARSGAGAQRRRFRSPRSRLYAASTACCTPIPHSSTRTALDSSTRQPGAGCPRYIRLRVYVDAGGLMSYGRTFPVVRAAAIYVDKILKGAKPGDLPVEQPTTFEFAINNRTAKAIGLTIPPSFALRADRIVE